MPKVTVLRVISKRDSFRRAGYQFSAEPTDIPITDLSKDQRAAIDDDPSLVAYETDIDIPDDAAAAAKAKPAAKK